MKQLMLIAHDEWRYWCRSQIVLVATLIFLALILATNFISAARMSAESETRAQHQSEAEQAFLAQPDRHPHRMVHYGHYLFRTPVPLSLFDPGLDAITGQAIFLEGHRQNSLTFSEAGASADFGGLSWLSPALMYQLFAPLMIVLLGHSALVREREASVLSPILALGVTGRKLMAGKALALILFTVLLLVPLIIGALLAYFQGERLGALLGLIAVYFFYCLVWVVLTLLVSTLVKRRSEVLIVMLSFWFVVSLVLPALAVNIVSSYNASLGKIESDLAMQRDIEKLGNGHNANDPAFLKLRSDLLEQHNVDHVEDLPVNFRGIVALEGERKLTEILNQYADARMQAELDQERSLVKYGFISPVLAVTFASRAIAATDLAHYHRFQREAEALRFDFVQGLNRAHAEKLSYQLDILRYKDEASALRARVDASNWHVLNRYEFIAADSTQRLGHAASSLLNLFLWLLISMVVLFWRSGNIKP